MELEHGRSWTSVGSTAGQRTWTGVTPGRAMWLLSQWLKSATLAALVSDDITWHLAEVLSLRSLGMWLNRSKVQRLPGDCEA